MRRHLKRVRASILPFQPGRGIKRLSSVLPHFLVLDRGPRPACVVLMKCSVFTLVTIAIAAPNKSTGHIKSNRGSTGREPRFGDDGAGKGCNLAFLYSICTSATVWQHSHVECVARPWTTAVLDSTSDHGTSKWLSIIPISIHELTG